MKKLTLAFLVSALFVLVGCDALSWSPTEPTMNNIEQPDAGINLEVTNLPGTIWYNDQILFEYFLECNHCTFEEIQIYLNGYYLGSTNSQNGFILKLDIPGQYFYNLELVALAKDEYNTFEGNLTGGHLFDIESFTLRMQ